MGFHASSKKKLHEKGFIRNVALISSGTFFAQLLNIAATPLLTRLYTPEDFGILAVYASLLSLVVIGAWRYQLAIPLPEEETDAANLLVLSGLALLSTTLLVAVGVWLLGAQIAAWTNTPELEKYLWLLSPGFLMAGCYQIFNYWAIRQKAYGHLAQTKLSQGLGQVITQLALGAINLRPLGLLVGDVIGRASGSGRLAALALKDHQAAFRQVSLAKVLYVARRYWRFPFFSSPSALLNTAGLQLPTVLIAAHYGQQIAGWFMLGQRVIAIPMVLVGVSVSQVYLSEAAQLATVSPRRLQQLYFKTARRLFMIGILPIAGLGVFAPWLFSVVFGEAWLEAGKYVQLLAVMFLVQFVVTPLSQTLNVLERQDWQLAWDAGRLIVVVGSLQLSASLALSARAALFFYGAVMLFSYCCLFLLNTIALRR